MEEDRQHLILEALPAASTRGSAADIRPNALRKASVAMSTPPPRLRSRSREVLADLADELLHLAAAVGTPPCRLSVKSYVERAPEHFLGIRFVDGVRTTKPLAFFLTAARRRDRFF
jgi:hypothetical protein